MVLCAEKSLELSTNEKKTKKISLTGMNKYEALILHTAGNACWRPILESKVFVVPQETEELFLLHHHPKKRQNYLLTVTAHLKMSAAAQVVPEKTEQSWT